MKKIALSVFVIAASGAYVLTQSGAQPSDDILGTAAQVDEAPTGRVAGRAAGASDRQVAAPNKPAPPAMVVAREAGEDDDSQPVPPAALADIDKTAGAVSAQAPSRLEAPPIPAVAPTGVEAATDPLPAVHSQDNPDPAPPTLAIVDVPLPRPRPEYRLTRASATRVAMTVSAAAGLTDGAYTGPSVNAYYGEVQVQAIVQGGRLTAIKVLRYPSDRRTSLFINRQALPRLRDEVIRAQSAHVDIVSGATLTSRAFIKSLDAALKQANA